MGDISYNYYQSPVGLLEFAFSDSSLCALKRVDMPTKPVKNCLFADDVARNLSEYFSGKRKSFDIPLALKGTAFQEKVWAALLEIPYGQTCSYKDIAIAINSPKASRAVGLANSKNPIMIIVPCHRVISANGTLSGYACGAKMKRHLLELEIVACDSVACAELKLRGFY